ncbi:hypothetical protein [Candidatus Electronema sp. JM]|uniref:hypothetical protein n=1 Tax=Candidatus Electronema sp. JM TaxID=3401571 RepID=UPI003AA9D802
MRLKITTFHCLCDDFLISEGWRDDPQCAMSMAEVMTAALTAAAFFSGSHEKSCGARIHARVVSCSTHGMQVVQISNSAILSASDFECWVNMRMT